MSTDNIQTIPHYNQVTVPELPKGTVLRVNSGCKALQIEKGEKAVVDWVEKESGSHGWYRIQLWISNRNCWLYAASIARLRSELVSLNSGDPTKRVQFFRCI